MSQTLIAMDMEERRRPWHRAGILGDALACRRKQGYTHVLFRMRASEWTARMCWLAGWLGVCVEEARWLRISEAKADVFEIRVRGDER